MRNVELLNSAQVFFGRKQNVGPAIIELRAQPEIFSTLTDEFDCAVTSLNGFLASADVPSANESALTPNAVRLKALLEGDILPTLEATDRNTSRNIVIACGKAFRTASVLMRNGEESISGAQWNFHKDIPDNPAKLAAAATIEIYGLFTSALFPQLLNRSHTVVTAIEEMLALHHQDTGLFEHVREWYTEDEGFSPELTDMVAKRERVFMEKYRLRRYKEEDNGQVRQLNRDRLIRTNALPPEGKGFDADFDSIPDTYFDGGEFLIVHDGGRIVGMGALKRISDTIGEIKRVGVAEGYEKRGLGTNIALELEKKAKGLGYTRLQLDTTINQEDAQRMWTRLGYREVRREKGPEDWMLERIFYAKELTA